MKYYPIHMHLHCAHEASASIGSHMSHAKALGIEYLWLTEHDTRIGKPKGKYLAFSFPEHKLWVHLPDIDRDADFQEKEKNTGSYAFLEVDERIALQISAKKGQHESLYFHSQAKKHSDPLLSLVTVEMDADIEVKDGGFAEARCCLFVESSVLGAWLRRGDQGRNLRGKEAQKLQNVQGFERYVNSARGYLTCDCSYVISNTGRLFPKQ